MLNEGATWFREQIRGQGRNLRLPRGPRAQSPGGRSGAEGNQPEAPAQDRRTDPRLAEDGGRRPLLRRHHRANRRSPGSAARRRAQPDEESPAPLRGQGPPLGKKRRSRCHVRRTAGADLYPPALTQEKARGFMERDPVCGMQVAPDKAAARVDYAGKTYHFCAPGCARKFLENAEKYLEKAGQANVGASRQPHGQAGAVLPIVRETTEAKDPVCGMTVA